MLPFSLEHLEELKKQLSITIKAKKDLEKSSKIRYDLGFNASRSKITSANARLDTNAEYYRIQEQNLMDIMYIGTMYGK